MDYSEYHDEYNELLSKVADDLGGSFAALASPTLSKQETVTNLYDMICKNDLGGIPWVDLLLFMPRVIYSSLRMIFVILLVGKATIPERAVIFRSWLEPRCVGTGMVVDEHFRDLPDRISIDNTAVSLLHPYDYKLILSYYKKSKTAKNIFLTITVLGIADVMRLHIDYLFTGWVRIRGAYLFHGQDASSLINRSLLFDFIKMRSFMAFQEKYITEKIARFRPKSYVYVFENQSWEKISCKIMHKHSVKLIGVQGSGFSPVFLNFFPTEADARRCVKHDCAPDVIFTVGENFVRKMTSEGCYNTPVLTFGALRFNYEKDWQGYVVQTPIELIFNKILYAFPVHVSQYKDIIKDLIEVFGGSEIKVDLKLHPQYASINLGVDLPRNFNIVDAVNKKTFRHTYDFVLFNDNSFGLESLMLGVKSYQYAMDAMCIDDRFFYFDLWDACIGKEGLFDLRNQIIEGVLDKTYNIPAVRKYINLTYSSVHNIGLFKEWALS